MKVLAVYNLKGGVGKTTTAVNLAYLSARDGERTLLWDLDAQAAATFCLRVKPRIPGGTKSLLEGRGALERAIRGSDYPGLDLLPAELSARNLDLLLEAAERPRKRLRQLLRSQAPAYDLCLLDCPPSISLVSENVFRAADILLVPVTPDMLCARALEQLLGFLAGELAGKAPRVLPFVSMVDHREPLQREVSAGLIARYPELLATAIPYAPEIESMGVDRMPLHAYAPDSVASHAYEALWSEVRAALSGSVNASPPDTGHKPGRLPG